MVRRRWPGDIGEIIIAKRELLGVGEIGGDVLLNELLTDGRLVSRQPGLVSVVRVLRRRVR